ncbi:MAG: acyltransferase [bacterium]|nr:acyltransferase [Candidatus Limimorpha caballi]
MFKIDNETIKKRILFLIKTNWIKTIWFNFKHLPLKQAVCLPIFISYHTRIKCDRKSLIIIDLQKVMGGGRIGMVKLGYENMPVQVVKANPLSLCLKEQSSITFKGFCVISAGTQIYLYKGASLSIGENTRIGMNVKIYSKKSITIGDYCTFGWDSQVVDTDFHDVINVQNGEKHTQSKEIVIGDRCWICSNCSIKKGTILPDDVIVGSNSLCNKVYDVPKYSLIGGTPAKLLKSGLTYKQ